MAKEELLTAIDRAVEEGTFTLDAVRRVKEMRDDYQRALAELEDAHVRTESLDDQLQRARRTLEELKQENTGLREELERAQEWREGLAARQARLDGKIEGFDKGIAHVHDLLRNIQVRRSMIGPVVVPGTEGFEANGCANYGFPPEVRREETEVTEGSE